MLNSISHLNGSKVTATDGDIGTVAQAFFDDRSWTFRYLVVETGNWMSGREVLISPYAVTHPMGSDKHILLRLTKEQVRTSPVVDAHQPVSRQHERSLLRHYQYPDYWDGGSLWGAADLPVLTPPLTDHKVHGTDIASGSGNGTKEVHLRSSKEVTGYQVRASDDNIGTVADFVFDDANWTIRYMVVDTSSWWQGGHKVLVGMKWADRIDWEAKQVHVRLTRAQVKSSPAYEDVASIHREYETQLHRNYEREGYWA